MVRRTLATPDVENPDAIGDRAGCPSHIDGDPLHRPTGGYQLSQAVFISLRPWLADQWSSHDALWSWFSLRVNDDDELDGTGRRLNRYVPQSKKASSMRARWTQEEDDALRELLREGLFPVQIAKLIGRDMRDILQRIAFFAKPYNKLGAAAESE